MCLGLTGVVASQPRCKSSVVRCSTNKKQNCSRDRFTKSDKGGVAGCWFAGSARNPKGAFSALLESGAGRGEEQEAGERERERKRELRAQGHESMWR